MRTAIVSSKVRRASALIGGSAFPSRLLFYSLGIFVNRDGKLIAQPTEFIEDVLGGS